MSGPSIVLNPSASATIPVNLRASDPATAAAVMAFHQQLPYYAATSLHMLPMTLARALGVHSILVKDESSRFSLPSFKILGASWSVYLALRRRLGIRPHRPGSPTTADDLAGLVDALRAAPKRLTLITTTEGNWGRAVAWMAGTVLGGAVGAKVYVPATMDEATREKIRGEGAQVLVVTGSSRYDDCLAVVRIEAAEDARREDGGELVLVLDTGEPGYEEAPQWVVEGYTTMLTESLSQFRECQAVHSHPPVSHVIVPVGVGSVAQAVTSFWKSPLPQTTTSTTTAAQPRVNVITVEPVSAACLLASLAAGEMTTVPTDEDSSPTIMRGLSCGTPSSTAWPVLRAGVDAAVAVSEAADHAAVLQLQQEAGIGAGPCGAATLAALSVLSGGGDAEGWQTKREVLGLSEDSVVVLYCTEGRRDYVVPE